MKKQISALFLAIISVFLLCSCENTEDVTTTANFSEESSQEETTKKPLPSLFEMSPETMDTSLPFDIKTNTKDIDFDSFEQIESEDSQLPETQCEKVLKNEKSEYYFIEKEKKILVIFLDEKDLPYYSASYKTDTGALEYLGDEKMSWYFNEDGTLSCLVYTYTYEQGYASIYSFYTPDGNRDFVRTYSGYYSGDLTPLGETELAVYENKYLGTIEIIAQY